jgi:hypothetical protein
VTVAKRGGFAYTLIVNPRRLIRWIREALDRLRPEPEPEPVLVPVRVPSGRERPLSRT